MSEKLHRLTQMSVDEVSLVDRAANKRKYLVVKRKGSEDMSLELQSDGNGGLTAKGKKASTAKAEIKKLDFPPGFKEMVSPLLTKLSEKLGGLSEMVAGGAVAEIPETGGIPPIPGEFFAELGAIVEALTAIEGMYPGANVAAPEGEEPMEAPEDEEPAELEMRLSKAIGAVAVAKVGAKMSKERYDRFTQALSVLGSLLQELKPGPGDVQMRRSAEKSAPTPAQPAQDVAILGALSKLSEQVNKLAGVVTAQEARIAKADSALSAIQKTRGTGNAIPVEGSSRADLSEVSWPLDMNSQPMGRDKVGKADYFGDE